MRAHTAERGRTAVALVALIVIAGTAIFAGQALAASNATVTAQPAEPGATATHVVNVTVDEADAGTLTGLGVDYGESGVDLAAVTNESILAIGVDRGNNNTRRIVDVDLTDQVETVGVENQTTLNVSLQTTEAVEAGDEIVLAYENVTNPASAGDYPVTVDVNPATQGGTATATLTVAGGAAEPGETTTTEAMDGETTTEAMDGETTTTTEAMDGETTTEAMDGETTTTTEAMDGETTTEAMDGETTTEAMDGETTTEAMDGETTPGDGLVGNETAPAETPGGGTPGFTLVVAVLALIAVALLATRRR